MTMCTPYIPLPEDDLAVIQCYGMAYDGPAPPSPGLIRRAADGTYLAEMLLPFCFTPTRESAVRYQCHALDVAEAVMALSGFVTIDGALVSQDDRLRFAQLTLPPRSGEFFLLRALPPHIARYSGSSDACETWLRNDMQLLERVRAYVLASSTESA